MLEIGRETKKEKETKTEIENTIRNMYKDRNFENREIDVIIEFVTNFKKTYGDKYIRRVINRLKQLKEIRKQYNDSKYHASSKNDYIVFFKNIKDDTQFKYILEHELFHFIQEEGSIFEKVPYMYRNVFEDDIKILLFEEAFVQYFTACINNKSPEYKFIDDEGQEKKYWLNECYKEIVGYVEKIEEIIGKQQLLDIYMDDNCYMEIIKEYDEKYGQNSFAHFIEKICK